MGNGYLRGVSDTRTPLLVVVAANVVNLVLEVVLVYGFDLGVAGVGVGHGGGPAAGGGLVPAAGRAPGRLRGSDRIARPR